MIDLNFEGVKELEEFSFILDDGEYEFVVADAVVQPAKTSEKSPSLKVVLQSVEQENKSVWVWFSLNGKEYSLALLKDFLQKLFNTTFDGSISLEPEQLIGKHISAVVTQAPRQDKPEQMQNVVVSYSAIPF